MVTPTPLGIKRNCPSCNTRFYDLNKRPATCPKCQHTYDPTVPQRVRRVRKAAAEDHSQDVLVQHMAKNKLGKAKKPVDDEIEAFGELEPTVESDLEEIEEADDIDGLEELEDIEEDADEEEDIALETGDKILIDKVEEGEGEDEEEEEARSPKKKVKRRK